MGIPIKMDDFGVPPFQQSSYLGMKSLHETTSFLLKSERREVAVDESHGVRPAVGGLQPLGPTASRFFGGHGDFAFGKKMRYPGKTGEFGKMLI